jgi:hypothetical protein
MAKMSSSSSVFEKKGNPWVTDKEGRKDYGRLLETENPDLDQFFYAKKKQEQPKYVDPPDNRKKGAGDTKTRLANIGRKMNRKLNGVDRK